jgi:CsoR family transcriptional regulator, copper-sensing transcriptional repressor
MMEAAGQMARKTTNDGNGNGTEENGVQLDELQKNVLSRLRKIEGQIRGIQRMVEQGKECEDILVQFRAVRSALKSTTAVVLTRYLKKCQERASAKGSQEEAYEQLHKTIKVLTNFIDG